MRVTDAMRYESVNRTLGDLASQQADTTEQASTGRRVNKPSDDPIAAAEAARLSAAGARAKSQRDSIRSLQGDLELSEASLASASDLFARAHEIALQGANGSLSDTDRKALADEVTQIKQQLVGLANSRGARGYLFAGSQVADKPFDDGGGFSGDGADQVVDLGSGPTSVSANGSLAFTIAGGRNVFDDLSALASALGANDAAATSATLDGLEASRQQIETERGRVGLKIDQMQTADSVLEQLGVDLSKNEDSATAADTYQVYTRMTALNQSLERSVAVSRQLLDIGSFWNR